MDAHVAVVRVCAALALSLLMAGPLQADRMGYFLTGAYTIDRDAQELDSWIQYFNETRSLDLESLGPEYGTSFGATVFKGRRGRAGLEIGLLMNGSSGTDTLSNDWTVTAGHVTVDLTYAVNLVEPPGPFVPYIGFGLGVDVPWFRIASDVKRDSTDTDELFAYERLGFIHFTAGFDVFVHPTVAFGLRVKYNLSGVGTLHVSESDDSRFRNRNLPTARSVTSFPNDPSRWREMEYNKNVFTIAFVLRFHQRLEKAPGVEDD